jgi:hypothetical protein
MASHFESSELQLTPQITPLFVYVLYLGGVINEKKNKLKITFSRSARRKFQVIGWGITGAHDEYSKSVRPYVLVQNINSAAAVPLDVLLSPNLHEPHPAWDVNQSDAELLEDEEGMYALVQIAAKKPSRKRWKQAEDIQALLMIIEREQEMRDMLEYQEMLEHELAHAAEAKKLKKKKK